MLLLMMLLLMLLLMAPSTHAPTHSPSSTHAAPTHVLGTHVPTHSSSYSCMLLLSPQDPVVLSSIHLLGQYPWSSQLDLIWKLPTRTYELFKSEKGRKEVACSIALAY